MKPADLPRSFELEDSMTTRSERLLRSSPVSSAALGATLCACASDPLLRNPGDRQIDVLSRTLLPHARPDQPRYAADPAPRARPSARLPRSLAAVRGGQHEPHTARAGRLHRVRAG